MINYFVFSLHLVRVAKMIFAWLFVPLIVANSATVQDPQWETWKAFYSKTYENNLEEHLRYVIWKENLKYIMNHAEKNHSYVLAMNHFGDLVSAKKH